MRTLKDLQVIHKKHLLAIQRLKKDEKLLSDKIAANFCEFKMGDQISYRQSYEHLSNVHYGYVRYVRYKAGGVNKLWLIDVQPLNKDLSTPQRELHNIRLEQQGDFIKKV